MKFILVVPTWIFIIHVYSLRVFAQDGYKIDVSIKGLSDTTVILGHYQASQLLYPNDTAYLDKYGKGAFEGKTSLHQGLYFLYLPNGHPLDLIIGADQKFSLSTDTTDLYKNFKTKGSDDNKIYIYYIREMGKMNAEMKSLSAKMADSTSTNKDEIKEQIEILLSKRAGMINTIVKQHPGLMVSAFLNSTLELEVPDSLLSDQKAAFFYAKKHYFDNFDISDPRLLYTPLYDSKIKGYLDKMVLQVPDTLNKEIDFIMEKVIGDSSLFRHVLTSLFSKYHKSEIMGMDAVVVHIAEKYLLPKSWWLTEKSMQEINDWTETTKPILIGKTAPDFSLLEIPAGHFKQAANDTALKRYPHVGKRFNIHDLNSEYVVLYFWSPSCSHCKKDVPKMYNVYKNELEGENVRVIAINTLSSEDGKEKWADFINKYHLYDWSNAWYPYDFKYKEDYDIRTTPQVFVLNKNKEIIGKKIGGEQVPELIEAYTRMQSEETGSDLLK